MASDLSEVGLGSRAAATLHGGLPALADVIARLDSEVLKLVRGLPRGETWVSDVSIFDPTDPHSVQPGAIVLGVGLSAGSGEAVALVDTAGRAGAAAVAFRGEAELPERITELSASLDLALLAIPLEMSWGQLYSLLRTAIASAGAIGDADAAGLPVGDLFALADAVAAAVGGPVTIEDPHWRVLAYSNLDYPIDEPRRQTILGRTPPSHWQRRLEDAGVARALREADAVVRFEGSPEDDLSPRLVAPVRAGSELLGSLWVAEAGTPLGDAAETELLRAAELAAIHLVCHRVSEDVKRRARGAFVREVLEGRIPPASTAAELPFTMEGPVIAIGLDTCGGESPLRATDPRRVLSVINFYCEDFDRDSMCALVDDRFWALVPAPRRAARARTLELVQRIVERVERAVHVRLRAGIGVAVPTVADVPRSRRAAEQALRVGAERGAGERAVHIEDVHAHAVLLELIEAIRERPGLLEGKLAALLQHDSEHGTSYRETLRAYLDCWGDVSAAAKRLGVHANTLRYRVRRIVELSGLDLDDPDERFVTELQLRVEGGGL